MRGYPLFSGGHSAKVTLDNVTQRACARLGLANSGYTALSDVVADANVALVAEVMGAM